MKHHLVYLLGGCLTLLTACSEPAPAESAEQPTVHTSPAPETSKPGGDKLFYQHCSSCHAVCGLMIGPELKGITARHKKEWLYAFTRNSQELVKSGDKEAVKVYKAYNKAAMPAFPALTDENLDAIYAYIESQECPELIQTDVSIP